MAGRLEGKVALITGAARGQGRSHAIRLAEEGADIIAVDICDEIATVNYPQGTDEDLAETVAAVEALDRRIVARKADVRSRDQLAVALDQGLAELGHLDIVCCNAGIVAMKAPTIQSYIDVLDIDLVGVLNTINLAIPHLGAGAAIVITGSTAGLMEGAVNNPAMGPGGAAYAFAKRFLADYTENLAAQLAPHMIRVNCIHPTNCNTNLIHNDDIYRAFRPDITGRVPTWEEVEPAFVYFQGMPIPFVDPRDISNAVLFLSCDEGRYVTGVNLRVDAGSLLKFPNGPA